MNARAPAAVTDTPPQKAATYTPPTDAAESILASEQRERYQRARLAIAKDLLAGMLAGGRCYQALNWEAEAVRTSIRLAERLMFDNSAI